MSARTTAQARFLANEGSEYFTIISVPIANFILCAAEDRSSGIRFHRNLRNQVANSLLRSRTQRRISPPTLELLPCQTVRPSTTLTRRRVIPTAGFAAQSDL